MIPKPPSDPRDGLYPFEMKKTNCAIWTFFLLTGLFLALYPVFLSGGQLIPGDFGDARFIHAVLEFGFRWITGSTHQASYWDPQFFYPSLNTMAFSDNMLGSAPLYWLMRILGIPPTGSFPVWLILLFTLNFASCFLLLKKGMQTSATAACAGAFLFAFGSPRLNQMAHPQLLCGFYTPLALYCLIRIFSHSNNHSPQRAFQHLGWWISFGLACVSQLYATVYLGWFLAIGLCVSLVIAFTIAESRKIITRQLRADWKSIIVSGLFSVLLLVPFALHYGAVVKTAGYHSALTFKEPKIQSWIYLGGGSLLYFWQESIRGFQVIDGPEQKIGIGLVSLVVSFLGLYWNRKKIFIRVLASTFLVAFITMTSFFKNGCIWPWIYEWIPASKALGALSRIGLASLIVFAPGMALFIDRPTKNGKWTTVLILAVLILEQARAIPSYDSSVNEERINKLVRQIKPQCSYFLYQYAGNKPLESSEAINFEIDAIWASLQYSTVTIIPTLNGYASKFPVNYPRDMSIIGSTTSKNWLSLHSLDASHLCIVF